MKVPAPLLTADDAFNSNPAIGHIAYRLPSPYTLFGMTPDKFDKFQVMTFVLSVQVPSEEEEPIEIKCAVEAKCTIKYVRSYSPVLYFLNPPVVYKGSRTEFWFNPKSVMNAITITDEEEMPFVNAKIGGAIVDFEGTVNSTTPFPGYVWNRVRGKVTEQAVSNSSSVAMLWETGNADHHPYAKHCNFNASYCYTARTVPVIYSMNQNKGYTTGGQNLVIKGWGFGNDTADVKVDGVPCEVLNKTNSEISCKTNKTNSVSSTGLYAGQQGVKRTVI